MISLIITIDIIFANFNCNLLYNIHYITPQTTYKITIDLRVNRDHINYNL